jgi:hypothetical protein
MGMENWYNDTDKGKNHILQELPQPWHGSILILWSAYCSEVVVLYVPTIFKSVLLESFMRLIHSAYNENGIFVEKSGFLGCDTVFLH